MGDFDVAGMDPQAAKEYIVAVISTLKQTKSKRIQLEKELELWNGRVDLAKHHDRSDLLARAEIKVADIQQDLERITAEEAALSAGVRKMKSQLSTLQAGAELTVDTDRLLAEFELMTDKPDELTEKFKQEEAEIALQKLKDEVKQSDKGETEEGSENGPERSSESDPKHGPSS